VGVSWVVEVRTTERTEVGAADIRIEFTSSYDEITPTAMVGCPAGARIASAGVWCCGQTPAARA
jgi:hypothetical protein